MNFTQVMSRSLHYCGIYGFLAFVLLAAPGLSLAVQAANAFDDWELLTLPDKTPAEFTPFGATGLRIDSDRSVAFLYTEMTREGGKRLSWRWRVDKSPPPAPQDQVGRDDRPLAIHFWFPKPPEERSFFDDLGSVFGYPAIGRVMTYVWGGTETRGATMDHPHFADGRLIILRGPEAAVGTWYDEAIDLTADYRRAFGEAPPDRLYLAISADSDDLGGKSSAMVDGLRWDEGTAAAIPGALQEAARP